MISEAELVEMERRGRKLVDRVWVETDDPTVVVDLLDKVGDDLDRLVAEVRRTRAK